MTTDSQSFTVTLADGSELKFNGTQTTQTYDIEANGVLVITTHVGSSIQTDRYSPTAWVLVSECTTARPSTLAFQSPTPGALFPPIAIPTET